MYSSCNTPYEFLFLRCALSKRIHNGVRFFLMLENYTPERDSEKRPQKDFLGITDGVVGRSADEGLYRGT